MFLVVGEKGRVPRSGKGGRDPIFRDKQWSGKLTLLTGVILSSPFDPLQVNLSHDSLKLT